jgi:hypothetical protein
LKEGWEVHKMALLDSGPAIGSVLMIMLMTYFFFGDWWPHKFATDVFLALYMAYLSTSYFNRLISVVFTNVGKGDYTYYIPLFLGPLLYTVVSRRWAWLSRWPSTLLVGVGTGLSMATYMVSDVVVQITTGWTLSTPLTSFNGWVTLLGMVFTIWYFVYSVPHKGPGPTPMILDTLANVGKGFLMCYMAGKYAASIQMRLVSFISIIQHIFNRWLGVGVTQTPLPPPTT